MHNRTSSICIVLICVLHENTDGKHSCVNYKQLCSNDGALTERFTVPQCYDSGFAGSADGGDGERHHQTVSPQRWGVWLRPNCSANLWAGQRRSCVSVHLDQIHDGSSIPARRTRGRHPGVSCHHSWPPMLASPPMLSSNHPNNYSMLRQRGVTTLITADFL